MQTDIDHAVTYFQPDEQLLLRSATSWQANTVVGRGEDLPVGDASVDLLVSYAAVPLYSPDAMDEIAAECSRVLKTGVVALHGPMYERVFDKWERALRSAVEKQAFSGFESRVEEIEVADGSYADAYFTVATR
jgi:ubiquinone/menaquinone biosynthesis C-methylase UbiE